MSGKKEKKKKEGGKGFHTPSQFELLRCSGFHYYLASTSQYFNVVPKELLALL